MAAPVTRGSALPPWLAPIAHVVAFAGAVVCLYAMRQADPDLWGYLTYGRLFVERGALVTRDPFAYTSAPFQWVTFEYGAHVLLWWAFHAAGAPGLIAFKSILGGTALYCLYRAIRETSDQPFVWVPTFLLCTSAISRFFLFRPQLFTFAFFALFVAVLIRFLVRGRASLWVLPIAMLVWANTHGGFVAGLGALGLTILLRVSENVTGNDWRVRRLVGGTGRLWIALAACTLVTFVNPHGPRLWGYVLTEISHGSNRRYIAEWMPASFSNDPWSLVVLTLLTMTALFIGLVAHRRRVIAGLRAAFWFASCVPLLAMSYLSVRHVPLAAIWAGPVITLLGSRVSGELSSLVTLRRVWFLLRGFAVVPVCLTFGIVYAEPAPVVRASGGVLGRTHPCGAVNFLRENHLEGNVFNPLWWGSYVTWRLYPQIRVSMDGRNISLFSDEMVVENMRFYSHDIREVDLDAPLRYDTDLLLVPADLPVLARVQGDSRWRQVYRDSDAGIFVRNDASASARAAALNGRSFVIPNATCPKTLQ